MINESDPNAEVTPEASIPDDSEVICDTETPPVVEFDGDEDELSGVGEKSIPEQDNIVLQPNQIMEARKRLQNRICGLPEVASHPSAVAREMFKMGPELAVEVLHEFHRGLVDSQSRATYLGVTRLFTAQQELPYHLKQPMYAYAREKGYLSVAYCFLRPPAGRVRGTGECLAPDPPESDKTLGERRSLARSLDRMVIARVAKDPDPMVVRNLLKNPKLKEGDVVRIAATRPVRAAVLIDVARHRTWSVAPKVQLTLALNPYTPTHFAVALLPLLHFRDLVEMAADRNLHLIVREAADYLVGIRSLKKKG